MESNNSRIAKNTVFLYIRMIILMAVSLYTSRIILKVLGINDYGIYNLIGGFITLFSFISHAMVSAMQRFFNVALGLKDTEQYKRIYSMSINLFVIFSLILVMIGETVGLWFITNKVNIPVGRETAALWVWHISIITLIVQLLRTPDNASIIAHEKMDFYAFLSIGEAVLKLLIVFFLKAFVFDKLILYVFLYLSVTIIINIAYKIYCNCKFKECHYHFLWDKPLAKELLSFSGWTMLSSGVKVGMTQGENFLLNTYYSVAVNAARGVAAQVYNAVNMFLINFQTAFRPQIVKTYAAGKKKEHYQLLFRASRMSFFLMLVLVIPISFNLEVLLSTWLAEVPPYTKEFVIFLLIAYLFDSIGNPFGTSVSANGHIKNLQIVSALVFLLELFCSFFALRMHCQPYIVAILTMGAHFLLTLTYLYYSKKLCGVNVRDFMKEVVMPISIVTLFALMLPVALHFLVTGGLWIVLLVILVDMIWIGAIIYFLGLKTEERQYVIKTVKKVFKKNKNNHGE